MESQEITIYEPALPQLELMGEQKDVDSEGEQAKPDNRCVKRSFRGRPKGSKNKPKPPPSPSDSPSDRNFHLVIAPGRFVLQTIANVASTVLQGEGGLFVIGAHGMVSDITLEDTEQYKRHMLGAFNITSLSGAIGAARSTKFAITITGPMFQTWGGIVVGDFQPSKGEILIQAIPVRKQLLYA